jgi:hypothetical protein
VEQNVVARFEFARDGGLDYQRVFIEIEEVGVGLSLAHSFPGIIYGYSSITPLSPEEILEITEFMREWALKKMKRELPDNLPGGNAGIRADPDRTWGDPV